MKLKGEQIVATKLNIHHSRNIVWPKKAEIVVDYLCEKVILFFVTRESTTNIKEVTVKAKTRL